MPLIKLQFRPGLNRDVTNYTNEGGWWDCDKIRFRMGQPEKLGGWIKATPTPFFGVCRQMTNWVTTFRDNLLGLGTNNKFYIEAAGYFYDVTPLRASAPTLSAPVTTNCVQTTAGSNIVRINLTAPHGAETDSFVTIRGVTGTVGGLPNSQINGNHQITRVDADTFSIVVISDAGSTVLAGGGTGINIDFEIEPGFAYTVEGYGWGTGSWGRAAWGLGSTTSPVFLPQRDWWVDNFDNDMVANIRNGPIYWWVRGTNSDPSSAFATRAVSLASLATAAGHNPNSVPAVAMQTLVSQQDKHLLAFGAVPFGSTNPADFDPLLIRWADQDNPTQWTPEVTNSAGFIRVSRGSKIVRAIPTRQEILVFTDSHLFTLQFLGSTDVFSLQEYADNISIISPRAVTTASNVTYWMGKDKFYNYTGRVDTLHCTLLDYIFNDIALSQADQIISSTNEKWNEVWWFYPSAGSPFNNRYVVYNYKEQLWYYGTMERTAWLDTPLRDFPQACGIPYDPENAAAQGFLYAHESGTDADGEPMRSFLQSSDIDLEDGYQFMLMRRLIPDVTFQGSTASLPEVNMSIRPRNFPGASHTNDPANSQPVIETSVDIYTEQVFIRARARQMALKIMSENLGVMWQLGSPRVDVRPDGRR